MEWGFLLAGLFVGIMVGMTGVGGGSLMTPLLIFGFGIQPAIAVGTDLLFAAITKAGGIWAYWRHGVVQWSVVTKLAAGSLPATLLTLWFLSSTGVDEGAHNDLITNALGVALILTSSALLLKSWLGGILQARAGHPVVNALYKLREDGQHKTLATIATGAVIGVMVTLSSVGAGALGAVALLFLYPRMKGVEIVATDIAHAVPLTAVAGLGHSAVGTVDWSLLGWLLIGSLPGIYIGSHLGIRIPDKLMRTVLAVILIAVGVKCLI
ncbi:sulfite exporter TauE/SafE family protein [Methylophaga sp. OBS3]|uniref:sulfite exporter TauE/SafE family protein n=1 Tax=Methylophaga sp. OBS3 TaxID=2991934 RepID=UPI0022581116|nr:sulfite exporter TauE/SafE family protein [Methylophaga sp. OBS3]MCX4190383.1 sulfite exporter TauE/SafE family protein [Methylophaga sp. OBS3]